MDLLSDATDCEHVIVGLTDHRMVRVKRGQQKRTSRKGIWRHNDSLNKSEDFLKVHRSYIVNLTKIVDIEETNLVIKDKVIPVSRAHRPVLMQKIKTI